MSAALLIETLLLSAAVGMTVFYAIKVGIATLWAKKRPVGTCGTCRKRNQELYAWGIPNPGNKNDDHPYQHLACTFCSCELTKMFGDYVAKGGSGSLFDAVRKMEKLGKEAKENLAKQEANK